MIRRECDCCKVVIKEIEVPVPCRIQISVTKDGVTLFTPDAMESSLTVDPKQWKGNLTIGIADKIEDE